MSVRSILLAEDDPRDAALTLSAMKHCDFTGTVSVVADGEEVLDYLYHRGKFENRQSGNPGAVFLDLKMPKIDGLETLKTIKADPRLKCVPVVMLTSSRQTEDLAECYALGANAYVVKPVDNEEFASAIKNLGVFWAVVNEPPPPPGNSNVIIRNE